ncbi:hypothetical protein JTB14_035168 [Gonioctena quinquepunctata]|nr:hypothetical protein JTB14_035168 [Gonioctena quinquepunctata]
MNFVQEFDRTVNEKLNEANKEIEKLRTHCTELERKSRKNNLVLFGIKTDENDNLAEIATETLIKELKVNIKLDDVNNAYKLGKDATSPIVIEFVSFFKKLTIFQNKTKLRELNEKGISITNDMSKEDREKQKILRKHLKQNCVANIKGFTLYINNKPHSVEKLQILEESANFSCDSENNSSEMSIQSQPQVQKKPVQIKKT